MADLPPFPIEAEVARLFGGAEPEASAPTGAGREIYLDLAEAVVDEAAASWLDDAGYIRDPYENYDRWQGGTAARFACPAAILVTQRNRTDLIEPAARAIDQLCAHFARAAATAEPPFPPGVLDLTAKEMVVAYEHLGPLVDEPRRTGWEAALAGFEPEKLYTADAKLAAGTRATNYEAYACVGEWHRCRLGLADRRDWIERFLGRQMEWMTAYGLYRDPGEPALYDLSVRQNFSELLHAGYDGPTAPRLDELLRRGGITMLLMLSPNGWAPYGGRSNMFVHNEAMVAYVAEFEARRWRRLNGFRAAGAFKQTAHRAALAARPFLCQMTPLRSLKNLFPPSTKHGRDSGYGEYAVYSLLAASLFARAYLVADESIAECPAPVGSRGTLLHLHPEFHRTFATCGDSQVQIDTAAQAGYDATGLGRFHRRGVPPELGLSMSIAANPKYNVTCGPADRAAAIGPAWRKPDGSWQTLASCTSAIAKVECQPIEVADDRVRWRLVHELAECCASRIEQTFSLTQGELTLDISVTGAVDAVALEVPCLVFDGEQSTDMRVESAAVHVRHRGARFAVSVPRATVVSVDTADRANRQAVYRIVSFEAPGRHISGTLSLGPD